MKSYKLSRYYASMYDGLDGIYPFIGIFRNPDALKNVYNMIVKDANCIENSMQLAIGTDEAMLSVQLFHSIGHGTDEAMFFVL